jgi:protocatechuate 3,4-dioxygenase beta subunit
MKIVDLLFLLLAALPGQAAAWAVEPPALHVQVVDGKGRPVAGAEVRAATTSKEIEPDKEAQETVVSARTSPAGTAILSGLPADRTTWVLVEKPGFTPEARGMVLSAGGQERKLLIPLQPGGVAVGQVVDEKGRPVAGAEVELAGDPFGIPLDDADLHPDPELLRRSSLPSILREKARFEARTGRAGRFRFRDLPKGPLHLTIRHPGYVRLPVEDPVEGGVAGRLGRYVLRRGALVTGTVTDPAGRPIAGARIWRAQGLPTTGDVPPPATATRSDGSFRLPASAEGEGLVLCAEGFLKEVATAFQPDEPLRVTMQPAATLRGQVLGPDGSPLSGAWVVPDRAGEGPYCIPYQEPPPCATGIPVTTDAAGRFVLGPLLPGWYRLRAEAAGLPEGRTALIRAEAGGLIEELEIRLQSGVAITGRVTDPEGSPISRVTVVALSEEGFSEAETTAEGSFRVAAARAGEEVTVIFRAGGYEEEQRDIQVPPGGGRIDVTLAPSERSIEIRGHVLDPEGAPVEGALVALQSRRVHSSSDGSFVLRSPEEQNPTFPAEITVEKAGFARSRTFLRLAGSPVHRVAIRLEKGAMIAGRVLGLNGREEEPVQVLLTLPGENESRLSAPVDAAERFRLGPVASGIWRLLADTDIGWTAEKLVTIEPGQTEVLVDLEVPPVHVVSGRVLGPDGRPAAGIQLELRVGEYETRGWQKTGADGTFSIRTTDGAYRLITRDERFAEVEQPVRVDGGAVTGIELRLDPGSRLIGRFDSLAPGEVPWLYAHASHVSASRSGQVDLDGNWSIHGLTPGTWEVKASLGPRELRRTIEIPPGVTEIELDLDFAQAPQQPSHEATDSAGDGARLEM